MNVAELKTLLAVLPDETPVSVITNLQELPEPIKAAWLLDERHGLVISNYDHISPVTEDSLYFLKPDDLVLVTLYGTYVGGPVNCRLKYDYTAVQGKVVMFNPETSEALVSWYTPTGEVIERNVPRMPIPGSPFRWLLLGEAGENRVTEITYYKEDLNTWISGFEEPTLPEGVEPLDMSGNLEELEAEELETEVVETGTEEVTA